MLLERAYTMKGSITRRRGVGLVYSTIILLVLCGLASFAVDMGRVVIVKTQLRAAADAAALGAAQYVLWDQAVAKSAAIATAKVNNADGAPVILNSSDVEIGRWDETTRTFTPGTAVRPNAVKVTAHRTSARGTAVNLPFAKMIGASTCDVKGSAIAMATPQRYAAVGLDWITMGGNSTNAYRSNAIASADNHFTARGNIASNGNITLTGSTVVNGDAFPGVGKMVIGSNHVTGYCTPLTIPLVYPAESAGTAATVNDNASMPSTAIRNTVDIDLGNQKNVSVPGGTYYFRNMTMGAGSEINFTGPTTLYLTGNLSLGGHAITNQNMPKNLRIVMLNPNTTISLSGGTDLFADIYAPLSAITVSGNGDIYGAIVGKTIAMTGEAGIHYDLSLLGGVRLVK
jgi:Flp pilus assembly protein TadG